MSSLYALIDGICVNGHLPLSFDFGIHDENLIP